MVRVLSKVVPWGPGLLNAVKDEGLSQPVQTNIVLIYTLATYVTASGGIFPFSLAGLLTHHAKPTTADVYGKPFPS